jgi:hypothetical protein
VESHEVIELHGIPVGGSTVHGRTAIREVMDAASSQRGSAAIWSPPGGFQPLAQDQEGGEREGMMIDVGKRKKRD